MTTRKNTTPTAPEALVTPDLTDVRRALAIRSAQGWRPEPGDLVTGTVVQRTLRRDQQYAGVRGDYSYPVVTLERTDGTFVALHCFHTTLYNGMKDAKVQTGDLITVQYNGQADKPSKNNPSGSPAHLYTVVQGDGSDAIQDDPEFDF